jgi:1-acyl-sn-glycerol-3-phosphate acyltransferase
MKGVKYYFGRVVTFLPYRLGRLTIRSIYWLRHYRVVVIGREKLPRSGAVILAANHLFFEDSIVMGLTNRRQITFLAKSDYFKANSIWGFLVKVGFLLIGQIKTDRSGDGRGQIAMADAVVVLEHGKVIGWHFEGTRSRDGRLYKAHTGFAVVAQRTKATIQPTALVYPDLANRRHIEVHYGDLIPYSQYKDLKPHQIAELVTKRVQAMSGQERAERRAIIPDRISSMIRKEPQAEV